jgi:putative transposase
VIRDEGNFASHVDYIHYNPVKHGYVKQASDWPHSSIHRYIASDVVGRNWAAGDLVDEMDEFGERI